MKRSNPIHAILFSITFCYFINTNVAEFCNWVPFLTSRQFGDGDQYFYQDAISKWLVTKAKQPFTNAWDRKFTRLAWTCFFKSVWGLALGFLNYFFYKSLFYPERSSSWKSRIRKQIRSRYLISPREKQMLNVLWQNLTIAEDM